MVKSLATVGAWPELTIVYSAPSLPYLIVVPSASLQLAPALSPLVKSEMKVVEESPTSGLQDSLVASQSVKL